MNRLLIVTLFILLFALHNYDAFPQSSESDYPVIGKPIPQFSLADVHYYEKKTFSPREVENKWTVLDFWHQGCVSCVRSFPKVNALQKEFGDRIQFFLVAKNDKRYNGDIKKVFERYRNVFDLALPIAYDSLLFNRFKIVGVPHIVIIDPQYKVYAITYGSEITREKMEALARGAKPAFAQKRYEFERDDSSSDWKYALNKRDATPPDFLYRSVLSRNMGERTTGLGLIEQDATRGFFEVSGATLKQLYNFAYFGAGTWGRNEYYMTFWKQPILELRDSSMFQFSYNYSLKVPSRMAAKAKFMRLMQRDREVSFGNEVVEELRMMPCWILTVKDDFVKKLKTKNTRLLFAQGPTGINAKYIVVRNILDMIDHYGANGNIPMFDETHISDRIDIDFSAVMTDMEDVQRALMMHGLILERGEREMKVLVIRDPPPGYSN